jgi:hypothetical protein
MPMQRGKGRGTQMENDHKLSIARDRVEIETEIAALSPHCEDFDREKQTDDTCIAVGAHDALRWALGLAERSISEYILEAEGAQDHVKPSCSDCPPWGYSTDKTRCLECPRRNAEVVEEIAR